MLKKILIVSDCPSEPSIAGNRNCIKQNLNLLIKHGYDVYFLLVDNRNLSSSDVQQMKNIWGNKLTVFRITWLQHFLQKIVAKIAVAYRKNYLSLDLFCPWFITKDINKIIKEQNINSVIVNYIWLSSILEKINAKCKAIYTHDVFSYKNQKGHSMWFSFAPNIEAKALNRANHILAIQENEAIYFQYLAPTVDVKPVYMPFTYTSQCPITTFSNLLFFSGGNEHNVNGLRQFIKEVYPSIRYNFPEMKLLIGGSICHRIKDEIDDASIELKGIYDNPEAFYSLGNVVINPVFEGTGLKVKTFEAISFGKIVLAHNHSKEGVFLRDNAPIFECDTKEDYIKCLKLIQNGTIDINIQSKLCKDYIERLNIYILDQYKEILS